MSCRLLERSESAAADELLRRVDRLAGSGESLAGVVRCDGGRVGVGVLGRVASATQSVESAEHLDAASVVELGADGVHDCDVATPGGGPEALDGEERG
jgi:hypothetical protein